MTVTSSMIAQVSPYTVSDSLPFTTALYNLYAPIAKLRLDADAPDMPTVQYDYCHALLIAHIYTVKRGGNNVKAKSFGNASVTKGSEMTDQMAEYVQILADYNKGKTKAALVSGVERSDSDMGELRLDQGDLPTYEDDL